MYVAQTPNIVTVTMTSSNTEYELAIPAGTKKLQLATNDGTAFRFAFVSGKVASPTQPVFTVPANTMFDASDVYFDEGGTLYVGCDDAGKILQMIAWT